MGIFRGAFEGWHIVILAVLVIVLFGWKKLPDAARSVGRSMRIFKSEMGEMKNDGKEARPSAAASDTIPGQAAPYVPPTTAPGAAAPTATPSAATPPEAQAPPQPADAPTPHDTTAR